MLHTGYNFAVRAEYTNQAEVFHQIQLSCVLYHPHLCCCIVRNSIYLKTSFYIAFNLLFRTAGAHRQPMFVS